MKWELKKVGSSLIVQHLFCRTQIAKSAENDNGICVGGSRKLSRRLSQTRSGWKVSLQNTVEGNRASQESSRRSSQRRYAIIHTPIIFSLSWFCHLAVVIAIWLLNKGTCHFSRYQFTWQWFLNLEIIFLSLTNFFCCLLIVDFSLPKLHGFCIKVNCALHYLFQDVMKKTISFQQIITNLVTSVYIEILNQK
jgi:hypothetical protein